MKWLRGSAVKWALIGLGLLTTSCAGAIGAGAAVLVVGAGIVSMTCYDRLTVTVTDQLTGAKLCDAKVTFTEGKSVTEATSCYSAALSTGSYKMRVERAGLVPYEAPIQVYTGSKCRHAVQTVYVALERPDQRVAPQLVTPPASPSTPPAAATAPAAAQPAAPAAPAAAPAPSSAPAASPSTPAPSTTAFPDSAL